MTAGSEARITARIPTESVAWRRLPLAALLAALGASAANVLVFFAASGMGFITPDVLVPAASGESPITASMVVFSSVAGTVGATLAFAIVGLFAKRPARFFRILSIAVLILSFAMPFTIGAPVAMVMSLEAMHIVAWAVIVATLTTMTRNGGTR